MFDSILYDFLYILFLVTLFSYIIYNFYIDYKNWRNVGGFAEGFDRRGRVQQFTNTSIPASSFGFRNRRRSRSRSLWSRRRGRRGSLLTRPHRRRRRHQRIVPRPQGQCAGLQSSGRRSRPVPCLRPCRRYRLSGDNPRHDRGDEQHHPCRPSWRGDDPGRSGQENPRSGRAYLAPRGGDPDGCQSTGLRHRKIEGGNEGGEGNPLTLRRHLEMKRPAETGGPFLCQAGRTPGYFTQAVSA